MAKEMTVNDVKRFKEEIEQSVAQNIVDFEADTGLYVVGMTVFHLTDGISCSLAVELRDE